MLSSHIGVAKACGLLMFHALTGCDTTSALILKEESKKQHGRLMRRVTQTFGYSPIMLLSCMTRQVFSVL